MAAHERAIYRRNSPLRLGEPTVQTYICDRCKRVETARNGTGLTWLIRMGWVISKRGVIKCPSCKARYRKGDYVVLNGSVVGAWQIRLIGKEGDILVCRAATKFRAKTINGRFHLTAVEWTEWAEARLEDIVGKTDPQRCIRKGGK